MKSLKRNYSKIISPEQTKVITVVLVFILFFDFLLFPTSALAKQAAGVRQNQKGKISAEGEINQAASFSATNFDGRLPESDNIGVKWSEHFIISAYNSEAGQTDDSPCITANNFNVCDNGVEDTIAANFLPFGSKVKIPALFGDRVFIVRDRMNRRFSDRVDVWMIKKSDAINFGVKVAKVEVLK